MLIFISFVVYLEHAIVFQPSSLQSTNLIKYIISILNDLQSRIYENESCKQNLLFYTIKKIKKQ